MQTRRQKNRSSLIFFALAVLALALAGARGAEGQLVEPPPLQENLVDHDTELLEALWQATHDIASSGTPWTQCLATLEAGLHEHGISDHAQAGRRFRTAIILADQLEERLQQNPTSDPFELLVRSHLDVFLVINPLQFRSTSRTYAWDHWTNPPEHPDMDPAHRIYKRGRAAIPKLLDLLDEKAATRSARIRSKDSPPPTRPPEFMSVGDVALALIEGIAHCRFSTDGSLYVQYTTLETSRQQAIRADVERWLGATEGMSQVDAIVWQIENGDPGRAHAMIDLLLQMKENEAAINCLRSRFRTATSIEYTQAFKMINAGSREPLDFIHQVAAEGRQLDSSMVGLISAKGSPADCEMLRDVILRPTAAEPRGGRQESGRFNQMNKLRQTNNPNCVPVFIAIIFKHVGVDEMNGDIPTRSGPVPKDVYESAWAIQRITGISFGIMSDDAATWQNETLLNRVLVNIAEWWRTDGWSIYGFSRVDRHAPAGIR